MSDDVLTKSDFKIQDFSHIENADKILTQDALDFIFSLENKFGMRRLELLNDRKCKQNAIDNSYKIDFLKETEYVRNSEWKIAKIPHDLLDRRVEITGPVDRKMIINALNANVKVFMADFEDSNSPTWDNIINGQINLMDAVNKTINYTNPKNQKH